MAYGHKRIVRSTLVALLLWSFAVPAAAQDQEAQLAQANRLNHESVQLFQAGRYTEALPLAESVLGLYQKAYGAEDPNVAIALDTLAQICQALGEYGRAMPLFQRALAIQEKLRPESSTLAQSLNNLALLYRVQGDYPRAAPLLQRALAIDEKVLGPEHPDVGTLSGNIALVYEDQGDYARAAPLFRRALAIYEKGLGSEHLSVGTALNNLAMSYHAQADDKQAIPLFVRSLAIFEKGLGPEHPMVATLLNNLAVSNQAEGNYERAVPLNQRALAIREKALGPEHTDVAQSLHNLAEIYRTQGDYRLAESFNQRALAIWEKALGPEHPLVAQSLNNLAMVYQDQGDNKRALPLLKRSLAIREKALGSEHPDVALSVSNLAEIYRAQGDYAGAQPLFERALAIREKALGTAHPDFAQSLINLAALYADQGNYLHAAQLMQRALTIQEKALGPLDPRLADALSNMAQSYKNQGDYGQAGPLYERALTIWENTLGASSPKLAKALGNFAELCALQGDYAKAVTNYQTALSILEKTLGPGHPEVAICLYNFANVYRIQRDFAQALPLYQRALAILEKALGPDHPEVARAMYLLALMYTEQGNYGQALPLSERALAIQEKSLGPDHPVVALTLSSLASTSAGLGDFERAAVLYQHSLTILEQALGPDHPAAANLRENLSLIYFYQHNYDQALTFLQRSTAVAERNAAQVLNTGSQQQKQLYINTLLIQTYLAVSMHVLHQPQNQGLARLALTVILQRKGRALDVTSDQLSALRRHAAPEDLRLLDELTAIQSKLATLGLSNTEKLAASALQVEVRRLTTEEERLQDAISRRSAEFRAVAQTVTLDFVRRAVPPDSALVEMFVYSPLNYQAKSTEPRGGEPRYVAYVLRRVDEVPQFVDLGEAAAIEADAARFRAALQAAQTPEPQVKELARRLDERVMRPVRKLLGPTRRVFLSPDGALNLVPFDAFVDEDGHYLIENYSFNYLTSGRDLLRLQVTGQSKDAPTIVANPLFDMSRAAEVQPNGRRAIGLLGSGETATAEARAIDFTKLFYLPLAATAAEAKSIGALLPQARVWTQSDATEAVLKTVNRPRILHIATHGFFLPDQPQPAPTNGRQLVRLDATSAGPQQENPMLRSGLILAGVNQKQSGAGEDGVLTALEAAGLNLFGTKLVVLSACETGLGDVQNGAGVYGLRRALVLAGSETQVMSLWQVSDEATRDLMIAYYTRLQAGAGRIAALHEVQLAMLRGAILAKSSDAKADWRHPYYWAAFIPSGAWTTLNGKEPR